MDYVEKNRKHWNQYSREKGPWSRPSSKELIEKARTGDVNIFITTTKLVPKSWLPNNWKNIKVLGLASGGGQQMPLVAATGADVTSYDLSEEQLKLDQEVCERENLNITTIQGNMLNLADLKSNYFDLIINPISTCFISDVRKVWQGCSRVLKTGGVLISGSVNPIVYAISEDSYKKGELLLSRKIPCSDLDYLPKDELEKTGVEFSHTLTDLIGGQLEEGFLLTHFYEDYWGSDFNEIIDKIFPQFFATRAIKK